MYCCFLVLNHCPSWLQLACEGKCPYNTIWYPCEADILISGVFKYLYIPIITKAYLGQALLEERRGRVRRRRRRKRYPATRVYKTRVTFLDQSDEHVLQRYRLDKQSVAGLCSELKDDLQNATAARSCVIPVQGYSCLNLYTTGSFQIPAGDVFGICQSSMSKCISQVITTALVKRANEYIIFSMSPVEQQKVKRFLLFCIIPECTWSYWLYACSHCTYSCLYLLRPFKY